MKCINEELLWEYLDNEVDSITKDAIETHLIICSRCKDEMEEVKYFNQQFSNAVKNQPIVRQSQEKFIEIKLSYSEAKPMLRNFWRGFVMFGFFVSLITVIFIALAYPVQGTNVFETEFHLMTYALSQLIYFMGTPVIMDTWIITLTFSFLFWADKVWRSSKYSV